MRWLLGIIILIIIVFAGWYIWSSSQVPAQPPVTATSTAMADIVPGISNLTYTNTQLAFSIGYPSVASTTADFSAGYLPLTQSPVIAFELPQSMFAGTNLSEAGVYIGASSSTPVLNDCSQALSQEAATSTATIGGDSFAVFTSTGTAAGNIYQEETYRTIQDGSCLEIVELLHSVDIGNFPPGSVRPFDQAEFSSILNDIVQTFQAGPAQ